MRRWLTERPFAHRGLHDSARPENSLAAIEAALAAGYPVEIDVQVTADNKAAVFHDYYLKRMTGQEGGMQHLPSSRLAEMRLADTSESIPLLEDVLDLVAGRETLLVEIKNPAGPGALEATVDKLLRPYQGPIAIQSFNTLTLNWFARHSPTLLRGHLSCSYDTDQRLAGWQKILLRHYAGIWLSRPHFIAHNFRDLPEVVPTILRRVFRLPLLGWTARTASEYQSARERTDNVIFEGFRP